MSDSEENSTNAAGPEDPNNVPVVEPPSQRARMSPNLVPIDRSLCTDNIITRFKDLCSLDALNESEKNALVRTDRRYIDFQLLRVVMTTPNNSMMISRYKKGVNKRGSGTEQAFGRMFLCRIFNKNESEGSSELVYLMQGEKTNRQLWTRDNTRRDDGTLTIGCYFRILAPDFISSYLNGEIPIISTQRPAILMERPMSVPSVLIRNLGINQSRGYVLNNAQLYVQGLTAIQAPCNGNLCDKQRIMELKNGKCGCYNWREQKSRCVFNHSIVVSPASHGGNTPNKIPESNFSSQKFSQLYLRRPVPNSVRLAQLQDSNEFWDIRDKIDDLQDYVNDHGGWTVVGWYRLGMVEDKAMQESNNQFNGNQESPLVEASETRFHIIQIYPTRESFKLEGNDDFNFLMRNRYNTDNMTTI